MTCFDCLPFGRCLCLHRSKTFAVGLYEGLFIFAGSVDQSLIDCFPLAGITRGGDWCCDLFGLPPTTCRTSLLAWIELFSPLSRRAFRIYRVSPLGTKHGFYLGSMLRMILLFHPYVFFGRYAKEWRTLIDRILSVYDTPTFIDVKEEDCLILQQCDQCHLCDRAHNLLKWWWQRSS